MKLKKIVDFLDKELRVKSIKDDSRNGLQVKGNPEVKKIAFAVDNGLEIYKKAIGQGCDLLIVHHGLLWKGQKYIKNTRRRLDFLKKKKLSLYGVHLPLDIHPLYGNNAQLCRILGIEDKKKWGKYHGVPIGYKGKLSKSLDNFILEVNKKLNTKCKILAFGPKYVKNIGIVSGGGGLALEEAMDQKLDCFLVGELSHSDYHHAKEANLNVIIAGHYATETLGVKALSSLLNHKFNIESVFIDAPTGM